MRNKTPSAITKLLRGKTLNGLLAHVKYLQQTTQALQRHLPTSLSLHCTVANYQNGVLVLHADSAAWATKLRYQIPALEKKLKKDQRFSQLNRIQVKVRPTPEPPPKTSRRAHMSTRNAVTLDELADQAPSADLREALQRLAKHARQKTDGQD